MLEECLKKVCLVATGKTLGDLREAALSASTEWVELRLDTLANPTTPAVKEGVKSLVRELRDAGKEVILTLRNVGEGGSFSSDPHEKVALLTDLASASPTLIDVELKSPAYLEVIKALRHSGVGVLASTHNLSNPLSRDDLIGLARQAFASGANMFKAVFPAGGLNDNIIALEACAIWRGKVVSFCLGKAGRISRLLAPFFGAPFTYAFPDGGEPVAEGQLSVSEVLKLWEALGVVRECG